ncbi:MAG: peptidoglycan bridge formation glycyltransferase FemA/FemB family protein [Treponema sp.]|jgi:lipid II:glycine glycyltransferase (peptidoglycan interpeptide bridge formation enzyme)|nr:peptidoglycan bridge formation glycyltransferase FemA/FemB family protein [Treponema sp.]
MLSIKPCTAGEFPVQDNLFQSSFWGEFKGNALYFLAEYNDTPFPVLVLVRKTKSGFVYAYAPKAPSILIKEDERGMMLEQLAEALKHFLPDETVCLRFDLPWKIQNADYDSTRKELLELKMNMGTENHSLRKSPLDHLCSSTVTINLTYSPNQLLAKMRQTTRNSVRRAYKSDVKFRLYNAEQALSIDSPFEEWHGIYKDTALRKGFYFEEFNYFKNLFEMSINKSSETANKIDSNNSPKTQNSVPMNAPPPRPKFYLFTAHSTANKENRFLSGMVMAVCGRRAYYMYAGSSLTGRELMPNYGLQWEAQLFARRSGCTEYDFMGIPPNADSAHPMCGLYIFKTGFGGEKVRFPGAWDYVYNAEQYKFFTDEEQFSTLKI